MSPVHLSHQVTCLFIQPGRYGSRSVISPDTNSQVSAEMGSAMEKIREGLTQWEYELTVSLLKRLLGHSVDEETVPKSRHPDASVSYLSRIFDVPSAELIEVIDILARRLEHSIPQFLCRVRTNLAVKAWPS